MKGTIITRELKDGTKRYDAIYRVNGKQRQRTFRRRKDAEKHLAHTVKKIHDNTYRDLKPARMGEVFDRWLAYSLEVRVKEGSLRPSTAKSYRSMVEEHLRPALEEVRSDQFTMEVIEGWRAGLAWRRAARPCNAWLPCRRSPSRSSRQSSSSCPSDSP